MKSSEDLSGKRDVPHHFCAFPVFNQVTILGIELEYPPSRVDLPTPRSFKKDSVFAFFKDLLLCCVPVFDKCITHPDKRWFSRHGPGMTGYTIPYRGKRFSVMEKCVNYAIFYYFSPADCHTFRINRIKTEFMDSGIINNRQDIIPDLLSAFSFKNRISFVDQISLTSM